MTKAHLKVWRKHLRLTPLKSSDESPPFTDEVIEDQVIQLARFFQEVLPCTIAEAFAEELSIDVDNFWGTIYELLEDENA